VLSGRPSAQEPEVLHRGRKDCSGPP
jgi:hypothetical protein